MKGTKKIAALKAEMKEKAISSLRVSFEYEGAFFTDEEIQQMVKEVKAKNLKTVPVKA